MQINESRLREGGWMGMLIGIYAHYLRKVLVYMQSTKDSLNSSTNQSSVLIVDGQIH